MELSSRLIDGPSYTGLIETLVGMTIKLELILQTLDPIDDATSIELVSQLSNDAIKAAAFARVDPTEWEGVNNRLIAALAIKPN